MKRLLLIPLVFFLQTASGLYYQDLTVGAGAEAVAGTTVSVLYTGWLVDGTQFDSNQDAANPLSFVLGSGYVIDGFDEGITEMKVVP